MKITDESIVPTAMLVGFTFDNKRDPRDKLEDPLEELRLLVHSMGVESSGDVFQRNMHPEARTLISKHLLGLAKEEVDRTGASLLVVDDSLTGSQRANLEDELECEVLDRTEVILQIFAQRAQTAEGKLQVELAQLVYLKPRLKGRGGQDLSALGGGIGTRGPGETKLETDRRTILKRISALQKKLKELSKRRDVQRKQRMRSRVPMIALVGYTNAGKSTLLNAISGKGKAKAYTDDRLFATLDPLTRKVYSPALMREVLVTDTVGFIDRLPTALVAAFKATLEEAIFADLLAVVVDGSDPHWQEKMDVVDSTLKEIGAGDITRLHIFSKADLFKDDYPVMNGVKLSAITGEGIDKFWDEVTDKLKETGKYY